MKRSSAPRQAALAALLAAATLAMAAEPVRIQQTWSGGPRTTSAAPPAPASQTPWRQQPQRNDYNSTTQPQNVQTGTTPTPPANVQVQNKPNYQFTEVPPRSLW